MLWTAKYQSVRSSPAGAPRDDQKWWEVFQDPRVLLAVVFLLNGFGVINQAIPAKEMMERES